MRAAQRNSSAAHAVAYRTAPAASAGKLPGRERRRPPQDRGDLQPDREPVPDTGGDEFLKQLARIMKETVRETDLIARYGGEEFVIVATHTDIDGAVTLAEKVRTRVAEASFIVDETLRPRRMTVSIGVAPYERDHQQMFSAADGALYRAKSTGKNCVVCASPGGPAS